MGRKKQTLEAQLTALLVDYDLTGISMTIHRLDSGRIFYGVNAHAKDRGGISFCSSSGHDHPTIGTAVNNAVYQARAHRGDFDTNVAELAAMEETTDAQAD